MLPPLPKPLYKPHYRVPLVGTLLHGTLLAVLFLRRCCHLPPPVSLMILCIYCLDWHLALLSFELQMAHIRKSLGDGFKHMELPPRCRPFPSPQKVLLGSLSSQFSVLLIRWPLFLFLSLKINFACYRTQLSSNSICSLCPPSFNVCGSPTS